MKKTLRIIVMILAFLALDFGLAILIIKSTLASADSGFDFDYDFDYGGGSSGGGYGGGSSGGGYDGGSSGGSYGGSYSGGSGNVDPLLLIGVLVGLAALGTICWLLFSILPTRIRKKRAQRAAIRMRQEKIEGKYGLPEGKGVDIPEITNAFDSYVKIQNAWTARDLTPVRHLLSDEIYNMYQMQLDTLIENKQINVMENMTLYSGRVYSQTSSRKYDSLQVLVTVVLNDYIIDEKTQKVLKGKKERKIACVYELTFVKSKEKIKAQNCPSCGSQVENNMSTKCEHCGNTLLMKPDHYTMTNKRILDQYEIL